MKSFFGVTFKRRSLFVVFFANVGDNFLRSNNVERHFCPDFSGICRKFARIFRNFAKIFKDFAKIF